jgi:hypothetical protein
MNAAGLGLSGLSVAVRSGREPQGADDGLINKIKNHSPSEIANEDLSIISHLPVESNWRAKIDPTIGGQAWKQPQLVKPLAASNRLAHRPPARGRGQVAMHNHSPVHVLDMDLWKIS